MKFQNSFLKEKNKMRWILTALTLCFLITGSAEDPLKKLEALD